MINNKKINIFKPEVSKKTKKQIFEYINITKKVQLGRDELISEIIKNYKPISSIKKWANNIFENINNPKAKIAMYCKQLETKVIKESRDTMLKQNFPDVEEWTSNQQLSSIKWKVIAKKKWDDMRAAAFQTAIGYDPNGYGFYKFDVDKNIDGTFTIKWTCSASSG